MKKIYIKLTFFLMLSLISTPMFSQVVACNGVFPFEEQNGLLTIEMESGIINDSRWKIGTETESINGINTELKYLYWEGPQSFNALSNAQIVYKIKINNPGTYRFAWRMRVGLGTSTGEHNDAWLKIDGEDFYGIKDGAKVYPKPYCTTNTNLTCAAGSSVENFIKAFGNRLDWGFVTNTNDGDSHRVFVRFDEAKEYTITVDARSSYLFIDKMVLRRDGVSDSVAFNLANSESACYDSSLSVNSKTIKDIKIYPNPTTGKLEIKNLPINSNLIISNVYGMVVRVITTENLNQTIDISNLNSGVYFVSCKNDITYFSKKIIKL